MEQPDTWTMQELLDACVDPQAERTVNARTVRFWITEGLLDAPSGGRGAHARYGPRHAAQVAEIRRLQALGLSLANIALLVSGRRPTSTAPDPSRPAGFWARRPAAREQSIPLGPGIRLVIDAAEHVPFDPAQQQHLIRAAAPLLATYAALTQAAVSPPTASDQL